MDTPYLITDARLWERAEDPSKLTKKDLLNAIVPFVNCCYPRMANKLKRKFETFSTERLAILFGVMDRRWTMRQRASPPTAHSLSEEGTPCNR
jgi:hypothetical protein